ncbi:MAG: hypothetical protein ACKOPI_02050, partial [bacterium]
MIGAVSHLIEREQRLPGPPEETFEFFADAFNLEQITPPLLKFKVTTPAPIEMHEGTLITYRLRVRGQSCALGLGTEDLLDLLISVVEDSFQIPLDQQPTRDLSDRA